jgi:hypothetical protein
MTGAQLKQAMTARGWTVKFLARWLCVNPRTIRKWRSGENPVPRYVEIILKHESPAVKPGSVPAAHSALGGTRGTARR